MFQRQGSNVDPICNFQDFIFFISLAIRGKAIALNGGSEYSYFCVQLDCSNSEIK